MIGILVGIVVVGALSYATGLTKLLLSPFGSSTEYKSSESATAPELDFIGSGGRDRTADLGVMNPESAAAYNAFQRINSIFRGKTVV